MAMRKAESKDRRSMSSWRRLFLVLLLSAAMACQPTGKAAAQTGFGEAERAALVAQATAALGCVPTTTASLKSFLDALTSGSNNTGIPVVDCLLLNRFALYVLAQATPGIGQWDIRNSSMANRNALISGTQQGIVEAKIRAQQADNNMRVRMNYASTSKNVAQKYTYLPSNHLCPLVTATSAIDEVQEGINAVSQALTQTLWQQGVGGNNPNAQTAYLGLLCKLSLVDTSISRSLLDKACVQKSTEYRGAAMHANSVIGKIEYAFPSNIKKLKDGRMWLGDPKDEDMDAMSAIMFCASAHALTGETVTSRSREPSLSDAVKIVQQMRQQALSNATNNYCMPAVAERIAVPASVDVDELKRLHKAQALFCTSMKHSGCMSDEDYQACQKNGMSPLNMKRHLACQYSIPSCVTEGTVGRGFDNKTETEILLSGADKCKQFNLDLARSKQEFINKVARTSSPVGVIEPSPTDRQIK